jgi:hypothetical protein
MNTISIAKHTVSAASGTEVVDLALDCHVTVTNPLDETLGSGTD